MFLIIVKIQRLHLMGGEVSYFETGLVLDTESELISTNAFTPMGFH